MIDKEKTITNQQMHIDNGINTYKLVNGISKIKGGIKVLQDLSYPESIIISAKEILNNIKI
tara:strand:- start:384 stop:566 length:183 start_codon:yes stop_codon:yes gene_type:complete